MTALFWQSSLTTHPYGEPDKVIKLVQKCLDCNTTNLSFIVEPALEFKVLGSCATNLFSQAKLQTGSQVSVSKIPDPDSVEVLQKKIGCSIYV